MISGTFGKSIYWLNRLHLRFLHFDWKSSYVPL
jgi:hypothetical protein